MLKLYNGGQSEPVDLDQGEPDTIDHAIDQGEAPEIDQGDGGPNPFAHMENIRAAEVDSDAIDPMAVIELDDDGQAIGAAPTVEKITRAAFWVVFEQAFAIPGYIKPIWKPLAIQKDEKEGARAASDALYSLLEIYYPQALLPGSDTMAHLLVLGPFLYGKYVVVRAIVAEQRAARVAGQSRNGSAPNSATDAQNSAPIPQPYAETWHPDMMMEAA
jgi:hypothetical protein